MKFCSPRSYILAVIFSLFFSANVSAETYYVDSNMGDDKSSGTSEKDAWRSLARVNTTQFSPGDKILFKRGMRWRGKLTVPSSGLDDFPIIFGAYGTGDNPVIMRTVRFSTWKAFDNKGDSQEKTRIWIGSIPTLRTSWGMVNNGKSTPVHLAKSRFGIALDSIKNGHFYSHPNSGVFYYRGDSNPPGAVEIGAYDEAIVIENKSHIIIDSIDTFGPGGKQKASSGTWRGLNYKSIAITEHSSYIVISNLSIRHANSIGIAAGPTTSNIVYENLSAHHNGGTGIYMNSNGGRISNCRSFENGRLESGVGDRGGIGSFKGKNIMIEHNEVFNNGPDDGNSDFDMSLVQTGIMKILRNYIHDCLQGCLQIAEGGDGSTIAYNVISGYGTAKPKKSSIGKLSGIRIGGGSGGARNIRIYNNILHGGKQAEHRPQAALFVGPFDNSGIRVINNIFANNDNRHIYIAGGKKAKLDDAQFANNLFSSMKTGVHWKGADIKTLKGLKKTPYLGANSLVGDPLFSNVSGSFGEASSFELQADSPAINSGVYLGIESDYNNETVPRGAFPDIGAFEFRGTD